LRKFVASSNLKLFKGKNLIPKEMIRKILIRRAEEDATGAFGKKQLGPSTKRRDQFPNLAAPKSHFPNAEPQYVCIPAMDYMNQLTSWCRHN